MTESELEQWRERDRRAKAEDFRSHYFADRTIQTFRGIEVDRLGFVVWDGKLKRPYEVLREERYDNKPAIGG
jgi:hypothetical protein